MTGQEKEDKFDKLIENVKKTKAFKELTSFIKELEKESQTTKEPKVLIEELTFSKFLKENPDIEKMPLEKKLRHIRAQLDPQYTAVLTYTGLIENIRNNEPTKLTYLLYKYYEKGKKSLNKTEVISIAKKFELSEKALTNKWRELEKSKYQCHDNNLNSAMEFWWNYKFLQNVFNGSPKILKTIENDLKRLKDAYPQIEE